MPQYKSKPKRSKVSSTSDQAPVRVAVENSDKTEKPTPLPSEHVEYCSLEYARGLFFPSPSRHTFWRLERRGKLRSYRFSDSPRAPKFYKIAELAACFGHDAPLKNDRPA